MLSALSPHACVFQPSLPATEPPPSRSTGLNPSAMPFKPPEIIVPAVFSDDGTASEEERRLHARIRQLPPLPPPVIMRGLLSESQMAEVKAYAEQMPFGGLGSVYYGNGHEANFLHYGFSMPPDNVWRTFPQAHPATWKALLSEVRRRAHEAGLCALPEELNVRCIEYHSYEAGGGLTDVGHTDQGSVFTFSVQMSEPGGAERGGRFSTTDHSHRTTEHELQRGDGILFCSDLVHNVSTLQSGTRHSLVAELWKGATNTRDRFG